MHPNPPVFYFDQEKVLIRRCAVNNTAIRAVSRIEEPCLGRLSDSAEGPLGRRLFGSPVTTQMINNRIGFAGTKPACGPADEANCNCQRQT